MQEIAILPVFQLTPTVKYQIGLVISSANEKKNLAIIS